MSVGLTELTNERRRRLRGAGSGPERRGSAPRRRGRRAGPLGAPRRPGPPVARGGPRRVGGRVCAARGLARALGASPGLRRGSCGRCRVLGGDRLALRSLSVDAPCRGTGLRAGADPRHGRGDVVQVAPAALCRRRRGGRRARRRAAGAGLGGARARRADVHAARAAHRRGAAARGGTRPRAPRARDLRLAGSAPDRVVGDRPALVGGPSPGRRLPPLLHAPARADRGGDGAADVAARVGEGALRRAGRDGGRLRADRHLAVLDADDLLEPEGQGRQRVRPGRVVLPRQLGLLRPLDLRALPRGRDPRERGARALRAAAAGRGSPRAWRPWR